MNIRLEFYLPSASIVSRTLRSWCGWFFIQYGHLLHEDDMVYTKQHVDGSRTLWCDIYIPKPPQEDYSI